MRTSGTDSISEQPPQNHRKQLANTYFAGRNEKNPNLDIEETLKKFAPTQKKKLLKEKLLAKLLWGCITLLLGVGLAIFCLCTSFGGGMTPSNLWFSGFMSTIMIAVGIAFLINYFIGKKMLAKEIEAEQNKLSAQA